MAEPGRTALHGAALEDDVDSVRRELADGADPDAADRHGFTPLHLAAQEYALAAAAELLRAGADTNARNLWGNGPLFVAVFNSKGRGGMIGLLRAGGADPLATNDAGHSPLGLARLIDNDDVAQYFDDLPPVAPGAPG